MPRDNREADSEEETMDGGSKPAKSSQMYWVIGAVVIAAAGFFLVPKLLRPSVSVPIPANSPDLEKALKSVATPSNVNLAASLFGQVVSNVARGQTTTVIVSNQAPPVVVAPPSPGAPPQVGQPTVPPSLGGVVVPGPVAVPSPARGAGPLMEIFVMGKKGSLPATSDAPAASMTDDRDLFRAARFKDNPAFAAYQHNNLWLRWRGRLNVPVTGTHTFFHSINMDRLPNTGPKRATDYDARGRQRVYAHIYIDGQKLDSKDKKFSDIESALRTSFNASLSAGGHECDIWLGVESEGVPYIFDETSMTLEVRYANQTTPSRLTARDLAR